MSETGSDVSPARSRRDEHGAFLVLWALLLVAIMTMVGIVIDLGQLRASVRADQSAADLAALAAGPQLGDAVAGVGGRTVAGACADAFVYLKSNTPDLPSIATADCSTLGTAASCDNTSPTPHDALMANTSPYTIVIRYPVPATDITDPTAPRSSTADGTPCERMMVLVTRTTPTFFGRIVGLTSLTGARMAVVRAIPKFTTNQVAALIVLERFDCQALQASGSGNVLVKKFDDAHPGIIHADSAGLTSSPGSCSGSGASNYVVYGGQIPNGSGSTRPGQPSILAQGIEAPACPNTAGTYLRGLLDLAAVGTGHDAATVDTGVCPGPGDPSGVFSRKPFDDYYNSTATNSGINALRSSSNALFGLVGSPATLRTMGYAVFPDDLVGASCSMNLPLVVTQTKVFVNCADLSPRNLIFTGTKFLAKGTITVGANNSVLFPNATELLVNGCGSLTCSSGVSVQGAFTVNDGALASCASRTGPGVAAAHVVIKSGPLTSGGANSTVRLCQSFVYMSGLASPFQNASGSPAGCMTALPCPAVSSPAYSGYVAFQGRNTEWTASNQLSSPPDSSHPYEDLAFWTEAGDATLNQSGPNSSVGSNGATSTQGVYFMPNALFTFSGNTTIAQDLNAQFASRRLNLSGQGDLNMLPSPNDAVPIAVGNFGLIR
jgi:Flp pilus assembly protein TadG